MSLSHIGRTVLLYWCFKYFQVCWLAFYFKELHHKCCLERPCGFVWGPPVHTRWDREANWKLVSCRAVVHAIFFLLFCSLLFSQTQQTKELFLLLSWDWRCVEQGCMCWHPIIICQQVHSWKHPYWSINNTSADVLFPAAKLACKWDLVTWTYWSYIL